MAEAKVSAREAREVAEAARESEWRSESFVRDLFDGRLRLDLIHPYPRPDPEDEARARPFLQALEAFLEVGCASPPSARRKATAQRPDFSHTIKRDGDIR